MAKRTLPIFLEGYHPLEKLADWKGGQGGRQWSVSTVAVGAGLFQCRLCWTYNDQDLSLAHAEPTVEEAVWGALARFKRMEQDHEV